MPTRGEIWWCELDPTRGSEIQKTRPVIIVSSASFDRLPMRVVIPLTSWQDKFGTQINKVRIKANKTNGLRNDSAADFLQIRAVALVRLKSQLGRLAPAVLEELAAGIAVAVDYRP